MSYVHRSDTRNKPRVGDGTSSARVTYYGLTVTRALRASSARS